MSEFRLVNVGYANSNVTILFVEEHSLKITTINDKVWPNKFNTIENHDLSLRVNIYHYYLLLLLSELFINIYHRLVQ